MHAEQNILTIQIPLDLSQKIGLIAEKQGVSVGQLAMYILAKEIGNLETGYNLSAYWKNYTKEEILSDFDDVMGKVKDRSVPQWDTMT